MMGLTWTVTVNGWTILAAVTGWAVGCYLFGLVSGIRDERRRCAHLRQRCVHGDEINHVGGKRAQCLDCDRYLPDLPATCSVSGQPHASVR